MNKKILYIVSSLFFILFSFIPGLETSRIEKVSLEAVKNEVPLEVIDEGVIEKGNKVLVVSTDSGVQDEIRIEFAVRGESYGVSVPKESSVYEAMVKLASTTSFAFEGEKYSSLGYFIKKINDTENSKGFYWTLYVNGEYSVVGASQYRLNNGDHIEWKFENK